MRSGKGVRALAVELSAIVALLIVGEVSVAGSPVSVDETELAYDDGVAEASRAFAISGSGFAVRFAAPPEGAVLLRAKFHIVGLRGGPGPIEVHVWDANRNDLLTPMEVTPTETGWFVVDLSSHRLTVSEGFYVGYVQLSAAVHPWIGLDTSTIGDSSFSVPDWSRVLPLGSKVMIRAVIGALTGRTAPAGTELAYDDGTAEAGRGYALAGLGYAVRFTPPAGGTTVLGAWFYITGFRGDPAPIEIHVWNLDHRDLIPPFLVTPKEAGWFVVDLAGYKLSVGEDFFVGYVQVYDDAYPWIGFDLSSHGNRSYSAPSWQPTFPVGSNVMIRAVVEKEEER